MVRQLFKKWDGLFIFIKIVRPIYFKWAFSVRLQSQCPDEKCFDLIPLIENFL